MFTPSFFFFLKFLVTLSCKKEVRAGRREKERSFIIREFFAAGPWTVKTEGQYFVPISSSINVLVEKYKVFPN